MSIRRPGASLFLLLALAVTAAACGSQTTTPTPVLSTENFTGTLSVGGSAFKTFTVNYQLTASDASITVTSLTTVADNTPLSVTIGIAFGSIAFDGSCSRAASYTDNAIPIGTERVAAAAFGPGTYCIAIFDNGTLTEPTNWAMTVKHY